MDRPSRDEWVARVVAWHNRHPLARRIRPAQVQAMGWVRLPFRVAAAAGAETPRGRGWQAAFTEKFLPPSSPRRIARWALRHAQGTAPDTAGLPVREVMVDDGRPGPADAQPVALWLATAAVADGSAQTRVLLGPAAPHAMFGRRLWSRPRLAALASMALLTGLLAAGGPSAVAWVSALPATDGAPAQASVSAPAHDLPAEAASASAPAPRAIDDTPRVEPPRPPAPDDAPVRHGSVPLPPRGLALDDATKAAAREAAAAARAARAARHAAAAPVAYAVATPRVRTEAESGLMRLALQAAVAQAAPSPGCRVEALPAGEDWRVACWPFVHRADAERLREQLAARGHRLEVIDF
jgi:hypothetical protein